MYQYVILSDIILSSKVHNISNVLAQCLHACLRITVNWYGILRCTCEKSNVCVYHLAHDRHTVSQAGCNRSDM